MLNKRESQYSAMAEDWVNTGGGGGFYDPDGADMSNELPGVGGAPMAPFYMGNMYRGLSGAPSGTLIC